MNLHQIIMRLFIILFCLISQQNYAQSTRVQYFKDAWTNKEVTKTKAKYSLTTSVNTDGSNSKIITEISSGKIIDSKTYRGTEPFGLWIYKRGDYDLDQDYAFEMVYCRDNKQKNIIELTDYLVDNDSLQYIAPIISTGEKSLIQFLTSKIYYPLEARESGFMGDIILNFTINISGETENICIKKGAFIILDKEAMRVLRLLKFSKPAFYKGEAIAVEMETVVKFRLQ
jgi:TonB family protein